MAIVLRPQRATVFRAPMSKFPVGFDCSTLESPGTGPESGRPELTRTASRNKRLAACLGHAFGTEAVSLSWPPFTDPIKSCVARDEAWRGVAAPGVAAEVHHSGHYFAALCSKATGPALL